MRFSLLLPLALAGACFAQTGGPAVPPQRGPIALEEFLGLTHQQLIELRQLQRQRVEAQSPAMQQINAKQQQLNQMLRTPGADPAAVGQLMLEIAKLRESAPQSGQGLQTQALAVLTPEQKAKLSQLQEAQKLMPAINQATAVGLLAPLGQPQGPGGRARRGIGLAGRGIGRPGR